MNNPSYYPIFIKPYSFELAAQSKPQIPEEPPKPSAPKLIKKNWFEKLILPFDDYQDNRINTVRSDNYAKQLEHYQQELESYREKVKKILSETNIDIFRRNLQLENLKKTVTAELSTRETRIGRYEKRFKEFLSSKYRDKIKFELEFQLPNGNAFVPDCSYIDPESGLCIDIEIDEPYTFDSKLPIHCVGDDDYRNSYFRERGWFIIRLEESQIALYPDQCSNYIQSCIEHILEEKDIESQLPKIESWDYNKARMLANEDYRLSY